MSSAIERRLVIIIIIIFTLSERSNASELTTSEFLLLVSYNCTEVSVVWRYELDLTNQKSGYLNYDLNQSRPRPQWWNDPHCAPERVEHLSNDSYYMTNNHHFDRTLSQFVSLRAILWPLSTPPPGVPRGRLEASINGVGRSSFRTPVTNNCRDIVSCHCIYQLFGIFNDISIE